MKRIQAAWAVVSRTFWRLNNGEPPHYDHATAHHAPQGVPDMRLVRAQEFDRVRGYGGNAGW
ncbi:hypothetical protein [Kitasatospora kifunensis]|uniref:Uncharacterized protein n=1 Tax=Kitasatospora kifunensis TaxID=58351 RepID=A0A7W7R509_KITKI|nr:hypothetical protein [Kitasatospora kifunensis]MBB4925578.1 hypothetical protein [Kitasatospora kifunensis]